MAPLDPSQRVAVTGLGVVSSIGTGLADFWENLVGGRTGVSPIRSFDPRDHPVSISGEIHDFDPGAHLDPEGIRRCGRGSQLAVAAARLAINDAGLDASSLVPEQLAIHVGTTMGECQEQESIVQSWLASNGAAIAADRAVRVPHSALAWNVARELGLDASCVVLPTACAAGNYAIGLGFDKIRAGRASVVIAGGADAFSRIAFTGFGRLLALAPQKCQPFDKNRQGIVVGEGAGFLVLESLEHARGRGARVHAELLGYALSCDAHHMTIPHHEAVALVMRKALRAARVEPGAIRLISAHGTGTRMNDQTESRAILDVFGDRARSVPVNSIKSMLGHTMGAASALEAIACVMAVRESKIPPTINFETPDEECPLDVVPNRMREAPVDFALNNSFAFGGNNAATVFGRAPG